MKIAVLTSGNPNYRMGSLSNIHERIKHIQNIEGVSVDAYIISFKDDWLFRLLRQSNYIYENITQTDGVVYNNLWINHKLIPSLINYHLHLGAFPGKRQLHKYVKIFKSYDLLSVHTLHDMYLAQLVKEKYNIPFVTTWHGSDINIIPFGNKYAFKFIKNTIENTDWNYFVSKKLLETSDKIVKTQNKEHFYTGPADVFFSNSVAAKKDTKQQLGINTKYLIGFIGNINSIKNVFSLVDIFKQLNGKIDDISYLILGSGQLSDQLQQKFKEENINNILFKKTVTPNEVPPLMKALDVLVLPSKNEGLPRVTLEAQALGVHVVGSDVGGIPEAIGSENCFALDNNFVINISNRIVEIVNNKEEKPKFPQEFSWDYAVEKELSRYRSILNKRQ